VNETLAQLYRWEDADIVFDSVENVFCPTGVGGGVDATCGKHPATGAKLAEHLHKNPPRIKFDRWNLRNIKELNPQGVQDNTIRIPNRLGKVHKEQLQKLFPGVELVPVKVDKNQSDKAFRTEDVLREPLVVAAPARARLNDAFKQMFPNAPAPEIAPVVPTAPSDAKTTVPPEYASTVDAMTTQPVTEKKFLGGGCNVTSLVTFADGTKGVFKPASGEEAELRRGVTAGTYYRREAAAYQVAVHAGFADLVPPTIVREIDGKIGSVQAFAKGATVASDVQGSARFDGKEDLERAAAFDYLVGHSDRHPGNWMLKSIPPELDAGGRIVKSSQLKLVLIDNGLAFPHTPGGAANDFIGGRVRGHMRDALNPKHGIDVREAERHKVPDLSHVKWEPIEASLKSLGIEDSAIAATKTRLETLKGAAGRPFTSLPDTYKDARRAL